MRNLIFIILLLLIDVNTLKSLDMKICKELTIESQSKINIDSIEYKRFLQDIGKRESSNDYQNDKNLPYWGYYQIGPAVRKTLKVKKTWHEFKIDSIYQDYVMYRNMKLNERIIGDDYFNYFIGKNINGITITYSGILAASHLAGATGVKRFLYSNGETNPHDKFGTKLTDYLQEFSNYEFELDNVITS